MSLLRALPGVVLASSIVLAQASSPAVPGQDAASLLEAARTALGGDAALDAINTFVAAGSSDTRYISANLTMSWMRPDKFLMVTKPQSSYDGFNGDQLIHEALRPTGNPVNAYLFRDNGPQPTDAAGLAARQLAGNKHLFLALALGLFGRTFDVAPATFVAAGKEALARGPADRLDARLPDGRTMSLYLDAATHRPVRLTSAVARLTAPPAATNTIICNWPFDPSCPPVRDPTTGDTVYNSAALPATKPAPPTTPPPGFVPTPTAGDPVLEFSDYKCTKNVCWPHQFRTFVGGQEIEKVRIFSFALNAKISESVFKSSK